jgi:hypothetical protein
MRLLIFVLLNVDHAVDHAHRCGHEHMVANLIAAKFIARAISERRGISPRTTRGG